MDHLILILKHSISQDGQGHIMLMYVHGN